jgi:hypothetical protein
MPPAPTTTISPSSKNRFCRTLRDFHDPPIAFGPVEHLLMRQIGCRNQRCSRSEGTVDVPGLMISNGPDVQYRRGLSV